MFKIIDVPDRLNDIFIEPTVSGKGMTEYFKDLTEDSFLENGEYKINKDVRNSFVNNKRVEIDFLDLIPILAENGIETLGCNRSWHLLMYTEECEFLKHLEADYTALLFPPNTIDKFTGGELIIYKDGEKIIIEPSSFENYKLIIFSKELKHEVLTVLDGTRYVFKKSFYSKEIIKKSEGIPPYTDCSKETILMDGSFKKSSNISFCLIL